MAPQAKGVQTIILANSRNGQDRLGRHGKASTLGKQNTVKGEAPVRVDCVRTLVAPARLAPSEVHKELGRLLQRVVAPPSRGGVVVRAVARVVGSAGGLSGLALLQVHGLLVLEQREGQLVGHRLDVRDDHLFVSMRIRRREGGERKGGKGLVTALKCLISRLVIGHPFLRATQSTFRTQNR